MNIKYHLLMGISGAIILNEPYFLIGSIICDIPLIYNEYKLKKNKTYFIPEKVDKVSLIFYKITHSIWFFLFGFIFSSYLSFGILIHLLMDSISHTGIFSLMPFYPIKYKIKIGKEILK